MNPQFINALKAARKEAKQEAVREGIRALHSASAWSEARQSDSEYNRGLRDGIVLAMEAIGYNRWETQRGMKAANTKSGNLSETKEG